MLAIVLEAFISIITAGQEHYSDLLQRLENLNLKLDWTLVSDKDGSCVLHWICGYIGVTIERNCPPVDIDWIFKLPLVAERINMKDRKGDTGLHILLQRLEYTGDHTDAVIDLFFKMVKQGADLDLKDDEGWTARDWIHYRTSRQARDILLGKLSELRM